MTKTQIRIGVIKMVATVTNDTTNSIFNTEVKNAYLEEMINSGHITEYSSKRYERIFIKTFEKETELNKDLSEFTLEDIEDVLYAFEANNRNTVETYARIISSYLNWCVAKGYIEKSILAHFTPEMFEKYLTNNEIYFTDKQLRRYEDWCENYQDNVIIRLLFMGAGGKQMSEIRNLEKTHIDRKNMRLKLINSLSVDKKGLPVKFTERWLPVDERTITLIDGAIRQQTYAKRNGKLKQTENNNVRPFTDLVKNNYVIRASITKTENWSVPVDKFVIYRRLLTIAETMEIENLTAKFIQRSGMVFIASQLMDEDGMALEDLKIVADQFNMKSYHNLKGFLNTDIIRKTYPKK